MKLGIGLPNTMSHEIDRSLMLDWARLADEAGFDVLGTIDKPNYDAWEPLATLAGVSGVTERIRLATTILQLPNRNEVLVAKQAAVIDQLSAGRLVLGVAQGGREDDYDVLGADYAGRSTRFERQVERIREIWQEAQTADREHGVLGPPRCSARRLGSGRVPPRRRRSSGRCASPTGSSTGRPARRRWRSGLRASAKASQRSGSRTRRSRASRTWPWETIRRRPSRRGPHHVLRYYGQLWTEPGNLVHHGPASKLAEEIAAYERAGIDVLIVVPQIPSLDQVEQLAEHVLPAYR